LWNKLWTLELDLQRRFWIDFRLERGRGRL